MKIAIDVQTTRVPERVGMGSYVENLTRELKRVADHDYLLLSPQTDHDLNSGERFIWDQLRFPLQAIRAGATVIHQPAFSAPILPRLFGRLPQSPRLRSQTSEVFRRPKTVVTVHDLIVLKFPGTLPVGSRLFFSRWMPFTYRFVDAIICDSHATKRDLLSFMPELSERILIEVIHLAADSRFRPIRNRTALTRVKEKYRTGDRFVLHVGTLEPRKNLPFLVKVFAEVIRRNPILTHNLVISGKKGWYYTEVFDLINRLGIRHRVILPGYVSHDDLPALYCAADLFVFPSKYEGFGLPPLEAMQSGTPVIVAKNSSLPEVVGSEGRLVSTNGEKEWTLAISSLLTNDKRRRALGDRGVVWARQFTWQKTAEKTIKLYERLTVGRS